jgi:hypothetical protein
MKRREAIGGVTIAVIGIVLALSVGIAATAKGGVFSQGPAQPLLPGAVGTSAAEPGATKVRRTTTKVLVEAVVSQSQVSRHGGLCTVDAHIVATTPGKGAAGTRAAAVAQSHGGRAHRRIRTG